MSIHQCRFCGKNQDIFTLPIPPENPEDNADLDKYSLFYVCGSCWDAIAEIARLVYVYQKKKEEEHGICP